MFFNKIKFFFLTIIFAFGLSACVPMQMQPQLTQLQIREIQTRFYSTRNQVDAIRAVINALQDEGYIVKNADKDLGFIQASKESDLAPSRDNRFAGFWGHRNQFESPRWSKLRVSECSSNVVVSERGLQVRLIFQEKITDNFGDVIEVRQILDPEFYQKFFAKIDKSLFLQGQRIG